jgi:uncharacterized membrane protein
MNVYFVGYIAALVALVGSWVSAALFGALFGFCVYSAYDLTNLATLRGWPLTASIVDLAWGAAVTSAATVAAFLATRAV